MQNIFLYVRFIYLAVLLAFANIFEQGWQIGIISFLIPSILMGLGVAIDVSIATIVEVLDTTRDYHTHCFSSYRLLSFL
jgi:hypothetical protein